MKKPAILAALFLTVSPAAAPAASPAQGNWAGTVAFYQYDERSTHEERLYFTIGSDDRCTASLATFQNGEILYTRPAECSVTDSTFQAHLDDEGGRHPLVQGYLMLARDGNTLYVLEPASAPQPSDPQGPETAPFTSRAFTRLP